MATRQVYRGNPEEKQYVLYDNFSGGVNSTYAEEALAPNEFRNLINVNIDSRGVIENRKGFKEMAILTEIMEIHEILIPEGKLSMFKIIEDKYNLFEKMTQYETAEDFVIATSPLGAVLKILVIVDNTLYLFKLDHRDDVLTVEDLNVSFLPKKEFHWSYDIDVVVVQTVPLTNVGTYIYVLDDDNYYYWGTTSYIKNTGTYTYRQDYSSIKTYDYANNIYFSLYEVSPDLEGIVNYDLKTDTATIINRHTAYKPTPFEISGTAGLTGFNVLRNSPLLDIDDQKVALPSIRSIFLTSTLGVPLTKIPSSGSFYVNVIKTGGSNFTYHQLRVVFRDESGKEVGYELGEISTGVYGIDNGAYFTYEIKNLAIGTNNFLTIDIEYKDYFVENSLYSIDNIGTQSWLGITDGDYVGIKSSNFLYKKVVDNKLHTIDDFEKVYPTAIADTSNLTTFDPEVDFVDFMFEQYDGALFVARGFDNFNLYSWDYDSSLFVTIHTINPYYDNEDYFTVAVGKVFTVQVDLSSPPAILPDTNYYYITKLNGASSEYATVATQPNFDYALPSIFGQYYEVGTSTDEPIEPVDLSNTKIYGLEDRLIYYKGNTLWYSELFAFDYLPNLNFLILPIEADDEIVSINYFRGSNIVFTKDKIFRISGKFETDKYSLTMINDMIGCIAPNSVRNVNNNLVFLSKNGLYSLVATYYTDGLETIKRLDIKVSNKIIIDQNAFSVLYRDQYWLVFTNNDEYDIMKYYFDINLGANDRPFTFDKFRVKPDCLFSSLIGVYGIRNGRIFYNDDYYDFLPSDELTENYSDYTYHIIVETADITLGYPTHDKKFKSIYVKTYCESLLTLNFSVFTDKHLIIDPTITNIYVNQDTEEIEYTIEENPDATLKLNPDRLGAGGEFIVDEGLLGGAFYLVHKIIVANKAKNIKLLLEYNGIEKFNISSIGYLFKLGKVRETR